MVGSILAGLATGGLSNLMSEWHADKQMSREKDLMNYQNNMNKANALDAYRTSVQGMRMAGLNPAIAEDAKPLAPEVSKGSVSQAENVEFDPQTMLLHAQAENLNAHSENLNAQTENLNAQTEKTEAETRKIEGVDTQNVKADTDAKKAATLLAGANTAKAEEEAQQIRNINKVFQEENYSMPLFGQSMAQEWQKTDWYKKLGKTSKMVVDDIADGNLYMSIGLANALNRGIATDVGMNEAQKDKASFALTRSVIESQMKSPKVMKALAKTPEAQYNEVVARATQLGAETKMLNFDYDWKKEQKEVWTKNDPDKLYAEYQKDPTVENAAKWLVGSMRSTGADVLKGATPAVIHGGAMNSALKNSENSKSIKSTYESHTPALYGSDGSILRPSVRTQGVEKMRF